MNQFYVAMVDAAETIFNPATHVREDLELLSFTRDHSEANIPTATIEIKNPRVGLLEPGRKLWAWFSWINPENGHIEPLLFGRLVGVPADTAAEVITLKYVAKAQDYAIKKQILSDTLRVLPGYDPLFLSVAERHDVDKVLDGYSKLYHVDPVTLAITTSDVLIGEDGIKEFFEEDVVYDSLRTTLQQSPLTRVVVDATVNWTQFAKGHIDLGTKSVRTYVGEQLMSSWPKPYTAIGTGWSTRFSYAIDVLGTSFAEMLTLTNHFQNLEATHFEGDTMTVDNSWSTPSFDGSISTDFISAKLSEFRHNGFIDPGDPNSVDEPTSSDRISTFYALPWVVQTYIDLEYEASRQRTERLRFELQSDLQAIVADLESPNAPLGGTPDFEYVTLSGGDVARPQPPVYHWATFAGQHVNVGIVITPSNEASFQVCIAAGTAGSTEPGFSIIPGITTANGGVTWACTTLDAPPLLGYSTHYILGQFVWAQAVDQAPAGFGTYPSQLLLCIGEGSTGTGLKSMDEVPFIYLPNGQPVPGPLVPPLFSNPVSGPAPTWAILGSQYVPIMDPARAEYFTAGNGAGSYSYAVQRARSQLLIRSRAYEVEFECEFGLAAPLTCRHNVVVRDPRLPGGVVQGKVISCAITANGEGLMQGTVKIGCAIGLGNSLGAVEGVPEYADDDYCDPDYQWYVGAENLSDDGDIVAGSLFPMMVDDGLTFPLTEAQAVIKNTLNGNADNQALKIATLIAQLQANSTISPFGLTPQQLLSRQIALNKLIQQIGFKQKSDELSQNLENTSVYFLLLKPVQNGPFAAEYNAIGHMSVPLMVDLSASSSP